MKYAIIGTGAIGGFYGGMLAKSGKEVHFLFHSDYKEACSSGLTVDSVMGDFCINPIHAYRNTADMPACDIILVCLKTTNNRLLADMLRPILKPDSQIVLVQNGLGIEQQLADVLPPSTAIAGGMAFICSNKIGPAHIRHLDYGKLTVGVHQGDCSKLQILCNDLAKAGVETVLAPDLLEARWKKLVWNVPYNGMTVILDTTTEHLMQQPDSRALIYDIMLEVLRGAEANGVHIPRSFADEMMASTDAMRPYKPSMRLDYDHRRPMEIDAIYTGTLQAARNKGVDLPKIAVMEQQLRFIQQTYLP